MSKEKGMFTWRCVYWGFGLLGVLFIGLGELIVKAGGYLIVIGIVLGVIIEILISKGKLPLKK